MKEKTIILLEELKNNYSAELLYEVMDCFQDLTQRDFDEIVSKDASLFNNQDERFYDTLAIQFVDDLNNFTLVYFNYWETLIDVVFDEQTRTYFYNTALSIDANEDATSYINGFIQLNNGNFELALLYFNQIDIYIVTYFIAWCYLLTENYENSIKQNIFFLTEYEKHINKLPESDIKTSLKNEKGEFAVIKWNIYNDLGYCYNRVYEYANATIYYEKSLFIFNLEDNFALNYKEKIDGYADEFTIFINNYLLSLEKTQNYSKCIEVLNFVIEKIPSEEYFIMQRTKFNEKINNNLSSDEIIKQLFKQKKAFDIDNFEQTKLISKEKNLEDMIMEQIKYGFKVFNKDLEVYQDEIIFGRQYYIQSVNGFLDLLLIDKKTDIVYVVELKRDKAGTEVVEQTEKYINGLKSEITNEIRGIICLHQPTNDLIELVKQKENIELYTYNFEFKQVE
ncbi:MAG: endonuclease NucS domain-containing protein [Polaribacter sp.]